MKKAKHKRKFLVNKRYQLRECGLSLTANILVALLMALLLSWFYLFVMDGGVVCNHNRRLPLYVAFLTMGIALIAAFWSLHKSRSVAGMMNKINILLNDASRGNFPSERLVFRKGDYFSWLAAPLNTCLVRMHRQQKCLQDAVPELEVVLEKLESGDADKGSIIAALGSTVMKLKGEEEQYPAKPQRP